MFLLLKMTGLKTLCDNLNLYVGVGTPWASVSCKPRHSTFDYTVTACPIIYINFPCPHTRVARPRCSVSARCADRACLGRALDLVLEVVASWIRPPIRLVFTRASLFYVICNNTQTCNLVLRFVCLGRCRFLSNARLNIILFLNSEM